MITNSEGLKIYFSFLLIQHYCVGASLSKSSYGHPDLTSKSRGVGTDCGWNADKWTSGVLLVHKFYSLICSVSWGGGGGSFLAHWGKRKQMQITAFLSLLSVKIQHITILTTAYIIQGKDDIVTEMCAHYVHAVYFFPICIHSLRCCYCFGMAWLVVWRCLNTMWNLEI